MQYKIHVYCTGGAFESKASQGTNVHTCSTCAKHWKEVKCFILYIMGLQKCSPYVGLV